MPVPEVLGGAFFVAVWSMTIISPWLGNNNRHCSAVLLMAPANTFEATQEAFRDAVSGSGAFPDKPFPVMPLPFPSGHCFALTKGRPPRVATEPEFGNFLELGPYGELLHHGTSSFATRAAFADAVAHAMLAPDHA